MNLSEEAKLAARLVSELDRLHDLESYQEIEKSEISLVLLDSSAINTKDSREVVQGTLQRYFQSILPNVLALQIELQRMAVGAARNALLNVQFPTPAAPAPVSPPPAPAASLYDQIIAGAVGVEEPADLTAANFVEDPDVTVSDATSADEKTLEQVD
jgi:hypothetical protein